jgi:N6-L-threonylcarbamoyladenine synthase
MKGNALDFSFSGLKTAVLRWVEQHALTEEVDRRRKLLKDHPRPSIEEWLAVTPERTRDLVASFQSTVIEELLRRVIASADELAASSIIVSGGVASNSGLRERASQFAGYRVYFPSAALSTDNAVMIAAAAFPKLERREFAGFDLRARANLTLAG